MDDAIGSVIARVAFASSRSMAVVARDPYRETLRAFLHQQQFDRFADLRQRGNALHAASLMTMAFHDPKKLADEHRRLLDDAGLLPTKETVLKGAEWVVDAVAKLDKHEGRYQ